MLPTGVAPVDLDDILTKYYGTANYSSMPMFLGVSRHIDMYNYLCLIRKEV